MTDTFPQEADFVIVGGGSAGSVMASRLSEDPARRVVLLEAGGKGTDLRLQVPAMLGEVLGSGLADWGYWTAPQPRLLNRRLRWPRGKALGGSSAINAMCYERGFLSDYDRWAGEGAEGWSGAEALHFFKLSETSTRGASQHRGGDGPLQVQQRHHVHELTQRFVRAGQAAGLKAIDDFQAEDREGVGVFDTTTRRGWRCSAASAYLTKKVRERPNLTVITGAHTRRVVFDGHKATGVDAEIGGTLFGITVRKEVILCAGAIGTPHLLMLSGVGPASHLGDHGVDVVADRPGVGSNLQDHLDVVIGLRTKPGSSVSYSMRGFGPYILGALPYALSGRGPLSSNLAEGNAFLKSTPGAPQPDIQLQFLPAYAEGHGSDKQWFRWGCSLHACCLYPRSKGAIRLASRNPHEHPVIDPNYLEAEEDLEVMMAGARAAYEILEQAAFDDVARGFVAPAHRPENEDEWEAFIRARAETIYHPIGTAKMGLDTDEMAVADAMGRVYGTEALRVVDASLMPSLVGGNTNAPTIMMAERIFARSMKD